MRFSPPWWAWILSVAAVSLFGALCLWQIERGQAKARMLTERAERPDTVQVVGSAVAALPTHGQRVQISGRWWPGREVLLDNQTHQRKIGVHVLTPLRLADGGLVLINRGWLAASPYREQLPETGQLPAAAVTISGLWTRLPQAGIGDGAAVPCQQTPDWPLRLNYPTHAELNCLYSAELADGMLLLDAGAADGFVRAWRDIGLRPAKHYGYAAQWGLLALTAVILFLVLNLKRSRP